MDLLSGWLAEARSREILKRGHKQVSDGRMHPQVPLDRLIGLRLLPVGAKVTYLHKDRLPSFLVQRTRLTEVVANSML